MKPHDSILICGAGTHREFGLKSLIETGYRVGVVERPANIDASGAPLGRDARPPRR